MKAIRVTVQLILIVMGLTSCNISSVEIETTAPVVDNITESTEAPFTNLQQAEHRIGVRNVNGVGEFYDNLTNETFIPRGVNYVFVPQGNIQTLYLLKEGIYNPERTRNDFAKLATLGYNTVRVFFDFCNKGEGCIADDDNVGLNPAYLDNIADMMAAGKEAGIYILFTSNDLPDEGGYSEEANSASGETFAGYRNSYYLTPQAISATRRYWRDLLTGLVERNAAFDSVLGWQLLNEQRMFRDQPPLSLTNSLVQTTTGSYDMSDSNQKVQMVSDGLVYYIAQMKEEILLHDPTALVTMGFFVPEIAMPDWYVETASLLEKSNLDFFDFHAYPGATSLQNHVEHFGMIGYDAKPIILGEYGAFRHVFSEIDFAARAVIDWVTESCEYGFDGWLYWTYYPSNPTAGDQTWVLVDQDDYLLNMFAPKNQPNICMEIEISNDNLAYNKPVTASRSVSENPPAYAVDDSAGTQWIAGEGPVQWIEVDLQGTYHITEIRLLVAQYPAGNTSHRLQIRTSGSNSYETIHEFIGFTNENDWLIFTPDTPLETVSHIRIQTIASPSWVAWKEIQVYGELLSP